MIKIPEETINNAKKDTVFLAAAFLIALIIVKIGFFNEGMLAITITTFMFFWMFIIPGYFVTYLLSFDMDKIERLFFGFAIGAAVFGILAYYLGLIEINIKYYTVLVPVLVEAVVIAILYYKSNKSKKRTKN